ncbi:MAG: helix-turn-helix domain-containing protein [Vicinamibacterales bacterium]
MSEILGRVGARLKQLRLSRKLTQEQLAEAAGLSYKFVGEIERGIGNPTLTTLDALASALDVGLPELMFDENRADRVSSRDALLVREALDSIEAVLARRTPAPSVTVKYRVRRRPR